MNLRALRPGSIAAAAVLIGGVLLVALPRHGLTIVQLVLVTVAAAAGLHALAVHWSPTWWTSPFDRTVRPGGEGHGSDEIDSIRSKLSGPRRPIENAPPMPGEALRLVRPLIGVALERRGLDRDDEAHREAIRDLLSPLTWAVLTSDPRRRPRWFRIRRPDEREVGEVVHRVLDDLDRLALGRGDPPRPTDTRHPRTP